MRPRHNPNYDQNKTYTRTPRVAERKGWRWGILYAAYSTLAPQCSWAPSALCLLDWLHAMRKTDNAKAILGLGREKNSRKISPRHRSHIEMHRCQ